MHHIEHKQSENNHQKIDKKQHKILWKFRNAENSLIQEDSQEWENSLITHHKDCNQNDDESTTKCKHAEFISRMFMQIVWKKLLYHIML